MVLKEPWWLEYYRRGRFPCCFTCANFVDNVCQVWDQTPPQEFAEAMGKCDEWEDEIPF